MAIVSAPKDRFTALDTLAVVRELSVTRHARVDKVFDLPTGGFAMVFRIPREGRRELALVPGKFAAWLTDPVPHTEELSPFARELRRLLEGAVLEEAADPAGERLLELVLRRSEEPAPIRLALEMFGSGNLVVARGEKIAAAAHSRKWAHRTVGVGADYARPPSRSNPWSIGAAEIEAELSRSRTDLASTLGARLALGGPLAEELIARAGWEGSIPAASDPGPVALRVHDLLRELLEEVGDRPQGFLYLKDGVAIDVTPFPSRRWGESTDVVERSRPTFSGAAWEYFSAIVTPPPSPAERERTRAVQELEHQLERQRNAIRELQLRVESLKADAQAVFDHYVDAERLLDELPSGKRDDPTVEANLGGRKVELTVGESPRATAQTLFEEAKRLQAKLSGAAAAVVEAESKLKELSESEQPVRAGTRTAKVPSPRRRTYWFERYRWFISSEGGIVIAGRDASSNDLVVRRNLKDGDYYVHADLHGAASVIVKHAAPGETALTEATIREAAQWAVAFSKAWRAGHASAEAFWVESEQVSKQAASGEFVARGAWVIHGTKHLLRDLPLELGLGTVDYRGERLWTSAPPAALRARGDLRALLTPGPERERGDVEVALARELGVARTVLQGLLPAGGLSVRRA